MKGAETNLCLLGLAETPPGSPQPTAAVSVKATSKQLLEEWRLAKEREEREAWEEQLEELLRERRKRHNRLRKSLPEGSADVTKQLVKVLVRRIRRCWRPPEKGTGYHPGTPTPRPDVGAALRDARRSVLGEPVGTDTDSEKE